MQVPQGRGLEEAYRSQGWAKVAQTSDRLKTLSVEMVVGGRSQRDSEAALEKARGHFVLSKSAISTLTDTLRQEIVGLGVALQEGRQLLCFQRTWR